ncbi:MAG: PfkB family carbohydrate kinase [Nitrosotalea sp.]
MLKATNKKIVLVGDFSINQFYHGTINRIAHDAPVPIVDVIHSEAFLGSAGIIAEKLTRLGATNVVPIGVIGDDISGKLIREKLAKLKIRTSRILTTKRKTSHISRLMVNNMQTARFDEIYDQRLDETNTKKIMGIITEEIRNAGLIIIADYGFGTINNKIAEHIIRESERRNVNVFVTSSGYNYLMYKGPKIIIKINLESSALLIKEPQISKMTSHAINNKLAHILQSNRILLTRGEEGISIFNGDTIEMPATENKRVDVKGIGEIMTAVVNISLVNSGNFYESCKLGNIAAGVAVSKSSTDDVSLRDIRKAKKEYDEWLAQK